MIFLCIISNAYWHDWSSSPFAYANRICLESSLYVLPEDSLLIKLFPLTALPSFNCWCCCCLRYQLQFGKLVSLDRTCEHSFAPFLHLYKLFCSCCFGKSWFFFCRQTATLQTTRIFSSFSPPSPSLFEISHKECKQLTNTRLVPFRLKMNFKTTSKYYVRQAVEKAEKNVFREFDNTLQLRPPITS